VFSPYSALSNPAFLADDDYTSVRAAQALVLSNAFQLTELGISIPRGLYQSFGFSFASEGSGSYTSYIIDPVGDSALASGTVSSRNSTFAFTYATNPWKRLNVGANLSITHNTNFDDPILGMAVDAGVAYWVFRHRIVGNHRLGLALQNPAAYTYGDKLGLLSNSYPANAVLSWNIWCWDNQITAGVDAATKDFGALAISRGDSLSGIRKGFENLETDVSWRLGVSVLRTVTAEVLAGTEHWGVAMGINVPSVNNGRDLGVLYQYMQSTRTERNYINTFYLKWDMGKHRSEQFAQEAISVVSVEPNDLFVRARRHYSKGEYWQAYVLFMQILARFPDFYKNDWVNYYASSCLEEMDMRQAAIENYSQTIAKYPRSIIVSHADLGLMRVYYRENNKTAVGQQYQKLTMPDVMDSLKYHAYYLMGQTHMRESNYQGALQLFSQIPDGHPEYIFAQHSMATAYALGGGGRDKAETALINAIEATPTTPAQKEVVNRSFVMLGYLYYQQLVLSKAYVALKKVPVGSYYYEDAQLGLGWTALKARQWADCVQFAQELGKTSRKPVMQCEAELVEGYAWLMQKEYEKAAKVLEKASQKAKALQAPSKETYEQELKSYQENRGGYDVLAGDITNTSKATQSELITKQLDSLHIHQIDYKKKLDDFALFAIEYGRSGFFSRSIERILGDIEYAYAISHKYATGISASKKQQDMDKEGKTIDKEIEKLEKEMNDLNKNGKK
jgi:tetratricopeptide (TPR) repeat protein